MDPKRSRNAVAAMLTGLLLTSGAYSRLFAEEPAGEETQDEEIVGRLEEDQLRALVRGGWGRDPTGSPPDPEIMEAFKDLEPGATVTVYFGSGCEDSKREVPRLLHLIDSLKGEVPFSRTYIRVNEEKTEPAELLAGQQLRSLPTFVVTRDGRESGRIVERSPRGLEQDLNLLLDDKAHGLVSASENVIRQYLSLSLKQNP